MLRFLRTLIQRRTLRQASPDADSLDANDPDCQLRVAIIRIDEGLRISETYDLQHQHQLLLLSLHLASGEVEQVIFECESADAYERFIGLMDEFAEFIPEERWAVDVTEWPLFHEGANVYLHQVAEKSFLVNPVPNPSAFPDVQPIVDTKQSVLMRVDLLEQQGNQSKVDYLRERLKRIIVVE